MSKTSHHSLDSGEEGHAESKKPLDKLGVCTEELESRRSLGNAAKIIEGCVSCSTNNVAEKVLRALCVICVKAARESILCLCSSDSICHYKIHRNFLGSYFLHMNAATLSGGAKYRDAKYTLVMEKKLF